LAIDEVFVDTSALLALLNRREQFHQSAATILFQLRAHSRLLVTTEWVLTEFLSSTSRIHLRSAAAEFLRSFISSPSVEVVAAMSLHWHAAFALFERRTDKEWSLVDCSSILICEERAIREVFTHDHHFEQAGFTVLIR
jgi:hypothetical protein